MNATGGVRVKIFGGRMFSVPCFMVVVFLRQRFAGIGVQSRHGE